MWRRDEDRRRDLRRTHGSPNSRAPASPFSRPTAWQTVASWAGAALALRPPRRLRRDRRGSDLLNPSVPTRFTYVAAGARGGGVRAACSYVSQITNSLFEIDAVARHEAISRGSDSKPDLKIRTSKLLRSPCRSLHLRRGQVGGEGARPARCTVVDHTNLLNSDHQPRLLTGSDREFCCLTLGSLSHFNRPMRARVTACLVHIHLGRTDRRVPCGAKA